MTVRSYIKQDVLGSAIECLQRLPSDYRPVRFGAEERMPGRANRVSDAQRFRKFLDRPASTFFLFAECCRFTITRVVRSGYSTIAVDGPGNLPDAASRDIAEGLMAAGGCFVFACREDEYLHRNRHVAHLAGGVVESWVGRDLGKYVPGVYWLTLLDRWTSNRFDVRCLEAAGATLTDGSDGAVRVEMGERSEAWPTWAGALDAVLERDLGVFSLPRIRAQLDATTDMRVLFKLLDMWP